MTPQQPADDNRNRKRANLRKALDGYRKLKRSTDGNPEAARRLRVLRRLGITLAALLAVCAVLVVVNMVLWVGALDEVDDDTDDPGTSQFERGFDDAEDGDDYDEEGDG